RRWRAVTLLSLASLALPGLLAAFLVANGSSPLPNSVMTKLGLFNAGEAAPSLSRLLLPPTWADDIKTKIVMWALLATLPIASWTGNGRSRFFLGAGAVAGILHMLLGQFGWFHRYEVYIIALCGMVAFWHVAETAPRLLIYWVAIVAALYIEPLLRTP